MNVNVQMSETNQSFVAQFTGSDCGFKAILTIDDMQIPTTFKEEVS